MTKRPRRRRRRTVRQVALVCSPPNTWLLGPIRVHNPNSISIGSVVFAQLTTVTDRQPERPTDHATRSVTVDRIYVRSTAMWSEKISTSSSSLYKFIIITVCHAVIRCYYVVCMQCCPICTLTMATQTSSDYHTLVGTVFRLLPLYQTVGCYKLILCWTCIGNADYFRTAYITAIITNQSVGYQSHTG